MSAGASSPDRLTIEKLDAFLATPAPGSAGDPVAADSVHGPVESYLVAAAVLAVFDPFELSPWGTATLDPAARDRAIRLLLPRCDALTEGPDRGLWALELSERRSALRRLGARTAMRNALAASPSRRMTAQQRMFERLLDATPVDLATLDRDELAALAVVHGWVEGILDGLPDRERLRSTLARADLLAPMQRLAGSGFVGRERELAQLRAYVDAPAPPIPLFIHGTGGIGKSTLLARFVLTELLPMNAGVAYVDVDRPTIRPEYPATLLLEAIGQLQTHFELSSGMADSLRKEVSYALRRVDSGRRAESGIDYQGLLRPLARVLDSQAGGRMTVLIVDTLEEAQFLGSDVMQPLLFFLAEMGRELPTMRVILSGRTLPREFLEVAAPALGLPCPSWDSATPEEDALVRDIPHPLRPINLGVLDDVTARELLSQSMRQAGLAPLSVDELDEVIGVVTRNPMCLRLAARLLRDEGVESLRADRTEFLARLRSEKIQAMLYGRILRSIHGNTVKVAYPGLVVRRITPDVIREVLAGPCELDLSGSEDEHAIFEQLAREAALVYVDPVDGSLRHRPDVRRVMLADLADQVDDAVIETIDRNAVGFYQARPEPVARAEEIYHRLRLDEATETLDERWIPEAAIHLKNALEELPARQQVWLAGRLGVTLDPSVRRTASQEEWEAHASRSADRSLAAQQPERALAILHERTERLPRSRLYALEAEAFRLMKQPDEALRVARAGVHSAITAGAIDMALDLLLKMVVIEEGRGNLPAAERLQEEAQLLARHSASDVLRLRTAITGLRLQRQLHPHAREERARRREEAMASLTDAMLEKLRGQPVLLREVAAELGKQHARIAALAIETLGVETMTDAQAEAFGKAIVQLDQLSAVDLEATDLPMLSKGLSQGIAEAAEQFRRARMHPDTIRQWVSETMTGTDVRGLGRALESSDIDSDTLGKFRSYFREGVSSSLRGD